MSSLVKSFNNPNSNLPNISSNLPNTLAPINNKLGNNNNYNTMNNLNQGLPPNNVSMNTAYSNTNQNLNNYNNNNNYSNNNNNNNNMTNNNPQFKVNNIQSSQANPIINNNNNNFNPSNLNPQNNQQSSFSHNNPNLIKTESGLIINKATNVDNQITKIKKFARIVETNINNMHLPNLLSNIPGKGYAFQIMSLNGIKHIVDPVNKNEFFLRFFVTYYSDQNEFYGNTAKSKLIKITFSNTGYIQFENNNPFSFYFFDNIDKTNASKVGIVTEAILMEFASDGRLVKNSSLGWGFFTISENMEKRDSQFFKLYSGTPRNLKFNRNLVNIEGATISYACFRYSEIDHANFLLPTNIFIPGRPEDNLLMKQISKFDDVLKMAFNESCYLVPGLVMNSFPNNPSKAISEQDFKLVNFSDVYIKNIEMNMPVIVENNILDFARKYFHKKLNNSQISINQINVMIKERKLRCCVHNTWKFINTNGIDNYTQLINRGGVLISNNVQFIDNFFEDEEGRVSFVFELCYVLSTSTNNQQIQNNLRENLSLSLLQGFYLPSKITAENIFSSVFMLANVSTIYGDELFPLPVIDSPLKLNFIISKNKDFYNKTYKEEEITKLKNEIEGLSRKLAEEVKRGLMNQNQFPDSEKTGKLEEKIKYLKGKLVDNQKSLKSVYDKEDPNIDKIISSSNNVNITNQNKPNFNIDNSNINANNTLPNNFEMNKPLDTNMNLNKQEMRNDYQQKQIANNINTNMNSMINKPLLSNTMENINSNYDLNKTNQINNIESTNNNMGMGMNNQNTMNNLSINNMSNNNYNLNETNPVLGRNFSFHEQINNNANNKNYSNNNLSQTSPDFSINKMNNYNTVPMNNINPNDISINNLTKEQLINLLVNKEIQQQNNIYSQDPYSSNNFQYSTYNKFNYYDTQVREISKKDKANLISKGALTLNLEEPTENLTQFSLETELKLDQQAVTYLFHFIAYKPSSDILAKINNEQDSKILFIFSFWNFDNNFTDSAVIHKPENKIYSSSVPFVLVKEKHIDDKNIKVKLFHNPENDNFLDYRNFIEYLLTKQIFVQVVDSDNFFNLGYLKVPLKDFLRNSKSSKVIQKEYEMYDYYNHESKGFIIMSININGSNTKFNYNSLKFKQITSNNQNSLTTKKKVTIRPMNIDSLTKEEKEIIGNDLLIKNNIKTNTNYSNNSIMQKPIKLNADPQTQKRLRVLKYSNLVNKNDKYSIKDPFDNQQLQELKTKQEKEDKYFNSLDLANKIKEIKKKQVIQQTLELNSKNALNISLVSGQPHFFNYVIKNDSNKEESFHIIVSKPVEPENTKTNFTKVSSEDSVKVINDPSTWAQIVEQEKHTLVPPKNNEYDCISEDLYFCLKPEEKVPLLVKLLSFDTSTSNKHFTIWVYKGKEPLEYLSITLVKVYSMPDHQFEFNVPDNRASVLKIPNPFKVNTNIMLRNQGNHPNSSNLTDKILNNQISTHYAYKLVSDPTTNNFVIKYKPGEVNDNKDFTFNVYLYTSELKHKLYANWEITIKSLETIDVQTQLGSKVLQRFFVESSERRTIQCFASNSDVVYFTEKCSAPMIMVPDIPNEIKFVVFPKKKEDLYEVIINVVDISNKLIIKQMLVRVIPENPIFSHVVRIDCNIGSVTHFKYEYQSKLNRWAIIKFESNDEEFLRVRYI